MPELVTRGKFAAPVDRDAVARAWREQGYSCDVFVDPPGREWLDFVHGCNELVTVLEGKLEMIVDDQSMTLDAGDEVLIPRGAVHSVININNDVTRWLYGYDGTG